VLIDLNHGSGFQYGVTPVGEFRPSEAQEKAIAQLEDWYRNRTDQQQVFRLFGYAGTGKSTVLKFALERLKLKIRDDEAGACVGGVVTATFTGKAALVLTRKGTPAQTIHSLIYSVIEATEEEIKEQEAEIERLQREVHQITDAFEGASAQARVERARDELKMLKRPRFAKNPDSLAGLADLIVLDEVSMVGEEMAADLLSYERPILVLGDPGQLPPIKGEGAFTAQEPDVMLTEIHRQAAESAIIRLATAARNGEPINYGCYDDHVAVLPIGSVTPAQMLRGGQVICGKNATRLDLNNQMRMQAGFYSAIPTGNGEKVICLKNMNDRGLVNGMFISLTEIEPSDESHYFWAKVKEENGADLAGTQPRKKGGKMRVYNGHFLDHEHFDNERNDRDWRDKKGCVEATYGWAITCHKAQGSQWENIVVFDDGLGRTDLDRQRWLYTAITRAEKGLVLLK